MNPTKYSSAKWMRLPSPSTNPNPASATLGHGLSVLHHPSRNTTTFRSARARTPTDTMDRLLRLFQLLVLLAPLAAALKFDLHAVNSHDSARHERCIRNFVAKDQLVVVTATLDGYRGDGQTVNMHVRLASTLQS